MTLRCSDTPKAAVLRDNVAIPLLVYASMSILYATYIFHQICRISSSRTSCLTAPRRFPPAAGGRPWGRH